MLSGYGSVGGSAAGATGGERCSLSGVGKRRKVFVHEPTAPAGSSTSRERCTAVERHGSNHRVFIGLADWIAGVLRADRPRCPALSCRSATLVAYAHRDQRSEASLRRR